MQSLAYTLPAAVASLAYLDGRYGFSYDWRWLSTVAQTLATSRSHARHDDLNLFYTLEKHAQSVRRDHTWIIFEGKHYSYRQAYEIVLRYGTWLKSKGINRDDIVAIDFVNSTTFVWIWYGLWSIGATPAFINTHLSGQALMHSVRTSTARLVLVDPEGKDKFAEEVMAEHGFVARLPQAADPERTQAHHGFKNDIPSRRKKTQKASSPEDQIPVTPSEVEKRKVEIVFFDEGLENHILSLKPERQPNSERSIARSNDRAILIYTSGTTGLPKPAIMSWAKASLGPKFISILVPLKKTDVFYSSMPLYHSAASIFAVCATLGAGCTVSLGRKFSHKLFWPEVRESKATIIQYVGETCRYLLSAPKTALDKEHKVRIAFGNGMRPDVWEPFKDRFNIPTILEFYGATESPSILSNRSTNNFSSGAIGRNGILSSLATALRTAVVKIDPESESLAPLRDIDTGLCRVARIDEPGELMFKLDPAATTEVFQGYFNNSKATDQKIIRNVKNKGDAYLRSGDLVRQDKERRWYFLDRLGDTFRWKSENVSSIEVADIIGKHDAVEEASVYGVQVPRHDGRAGCAVIVLKSTDDPSRFGPLTEPSPALLADLADYAKRSLPAYALPIFLRFTRRMQTTGTNKQQKHLLQKDGIKVTAVEQSNDSIFWLKDGTYERFTNLNLGELEGGVVKL